MTEAGVSPTPETPAPETEERVAEEQVAPAGSGWRPQRPGPVATVVIVLLVLGGIAAVLAAWRLPPFATANEQTDNAYVRGRVTVIAPQVSGYITQVLVRDFAQVKVGDVLAVIDQRIYRQRVDQAQAQVGAQNATLANALQAGRSRTASLGAQEAAVANAQAQLMRAQADMARVNDLVTDGSVSLRERDQTLAALRQAEAGVKQATAAREIARQDIRTVEVGRGGRRAGVSGSEAALRLAQIDLANTVIRAPEAGQLSEVGVRVGQYVTAGSQLMFLVPAETWVIANFKEAQTARMTVGQPATFIVDGLANARLTGRVERISPAAGSEFAVLKSDNATGNFTKVPQRIAVRIRVDAGQRLAARLRPGMSVEARVDTSGGPAGAVRERLVGHPHPSHDLRSRAPFLSLWEREGAPEARKGGGDGGRFALLACLLLSACIGPRPPVPAAAQVTPPPAWRTALGPAAPIRADWWAAFGDPVLTALVERALANNVDIAVAASRIDEARAQFRLARAQLSPTVGGAVPSTSGQTLSPFGTPSDAIGAQPAITASYDLDLFGRLRQLSRATQAQVLATEAARDTVRLATASAVASGYVLLRALDRRLAVARETLAARADALRIARRRADTGYTSALELHQAEGEYRSTEALAAAAALAVTRQENGLSLLLGDAPQAIPRGLAIDRLAAPAIPDGLPSDLLRRRPDIFQAEQSLVAADRTLDSARAAMLPNIALTGSAGVALSTALANPVGVFGIGASILSPIFDAGRLRAQTDTAAARRDQAAFAYCRAALTAFREVADSFAGVQRSGEQATASALQRDALAAALINARNRYRAGYSSYLEQLDAQRGLLSAELTLIGAESDRLTAYVALYQAMGGGWSPADVASVNR